MRKLAKEEGRTRAAPLEGGARRERLLWPDGDCDPEGYKDSLDVTVSAHGHSAREAQPRSRWLLFADLALSSALKRRSRKGAAALADSLRRLNDERVRFIEVDLDLALTMAGLAAAAPAGSEKRQRNARSARSAYDALSRFCGKVCATAAQRRLLGRKLTHLRILLGDLGERFQPLPFAA